jgi:hypothetical protein
MAEILLHSSGVLFQNKNKTIQWCLLTDLYVQNSTPRVASCMQGESGPRGGCAFLRPWHLLGEHAPILAAVMTPHNWN